MAPSNEYHYIGGADTKLWGQLESCKERKRGETENTRTKTERKASSCLLSSLLSVDS